MILIAGGAEESWGCGVQAVLECVSEGCEVERGCPL
jgi:hypothetical protein